MDLPEGEDISLVPREEILRRIGWTTDDFQGPQEYLVRHGFIDQSEYDVWVAEPHPLRRTFNPSDLRDLIFMRSRSIAEYAPTWETPIEGPDHYNRMFHKGKRPKTVITI